MTGRFTTALGLNGFLIFLLLALFAATAWANPVLRTSAVVNGNVIRLGDLFDGAGDKADIPVAPAPPYGRDANYDANWLMAVAQAHGLNWQPLTTVDHIVVERAGHEIENERVREAVNRAVNNEIDKRHPGKIVDIDFDGRVDDLYSPPSVAPTLVVSNLLIDNLDNRFDASVSLRGVPGMETHVSGHIYDVVMVPVPDQRIGRNQIISRNDITYLKVRADQLGTDVVTDPSKIVGMAPRRMLAENTPIREGDLHPPIIVARGSLVGMTLTSRYMVLTAQGKALEDGAQGQVIKVMNTQSKTTIDAVVTGPGRVRVSAPGFSTADAG